MLFFHSFPESQAALALAIFLATFIYEDGATLLAATAAASGALDPRLGLLTTFLGIWVGDMGLYGLGASFGRRTAQSCWLQKYLRPESLAKAELWLHACLRRGHPEFPLDRLKCEVEPVLAESRPGVADLYLERRPLQH